MSQYLPKDARVKSKWLSLFASAALVCTAWLLPASSHASESARTTQSTTLREAPNAHSKPVATLASDTEVRVLARQIGWVRVDAAGQQGWLPNGHIKALFAIKESSPSLRSGFLSWFTAILKPDAARASAGVSAANRVSTATIGIRGLAEDGALGAKSHSEELQKLKLYSVSRLDAEDFGRSAQLAPNNVAYID
jgi:hypothetical protein